LHLVVPKSAPVLDENYVFYGTDLGEFIALHQEDGSLAWNFRIGSHPKGKGIFSSPALYNELIYFGAHDGNVYALENLGKVDGFSQMLIGSVRRHRLHLTSTCFLLDLNSGFLKKGVVLSRSTFFPAIKFGSIVYPSTPTVRLSILRKKILSDPDPEILTLGRILKTE